MSRKLTTSDRSALIRLASKMEKGSEERKAILNGLKGASTKTAADFTFTKNTDVERWENGNKDPNGDFFKKGEGINGKLIKEVGGQLHVETPRKEIYIFPKANVKVASTKTAAEWGTLRDRVQEMWGKFNTETVVQLMHLAKADGLPVYRPRYSNTATFGRQVTNMSLNHGARGGKPDTLMVWIYGDDVQDKKFVTKSLADMDPKAAAAYIWKNTPAKYKK